MSHDSKECFWFAVDQLETKLQVSRWVAMVAMVEKLLHRRTGVPARVYVHFFAVSVVCTKQVSWATVHAGAYGAQVFLTSGYIFATLSLQCVHMRSGMSS